MSPNDFCELFSEWQFESISIRDLVDWSLAKGGRRLLMPPIQRSVVWSNEQVINYWDSLLRGYPAGMMLVHRPHKTETQSSKARDAHGTTRDAHASDLLLLDGQQRIASILLGFGEGQMKENRRLWVDLGTISNKSVGLKFQLRISSTGQPFGYRPDAPNQKAELHKRRKRWEEWEEKHPDRRRPQDAFLDAEGSDIIDAKCAVPFAKVCELLRRGHDSAIATLSEYEGSSPTTIHDFITALESALRSKVVLQLVETRIVDNQEDYLRFFERVGQGGTRLSDDELTYSIIKHEYPEIHDRMKEVMKSAGRFAGEVDLVLAALRVAKAVAPWEGAKEGERISRPTPAFVSQLKDRGRVQSKFFEMIPPSGREGQLRAALIQVRKALSYDGDIHPRGLPAMLLGRLPKELVDVLILFVVMRGVESPWTEDARTSLTAFTLHWLLFVNNDSKAASHAFEYALVNGAFTRESIRNLVKQYEDDGIAYFLPRRSVLSDLWNQVEKGTHKLRSWTERFTAADHADEHKPGEALRVLSTSEERVKRALLWLQRDYIAKTFPDYDPTSDRDEDLPIDLDHIVPQELFGFDWRRSNIRLESEAISDNFRYWRSTIGNSLGNRRWLAVSDNRSRGKGPYVPLEKNADLVSKPDDWNRLIPQDKDDHPWSKDDVASFQRLIDLRALELYDKLLTESGIEDILG